jgi:DNA-binding PadR family transcriptional regulator
MPGLYSLDAGRATRQLRCRLIAHLAINGYAILQESASLGFPLSVGTLYGSLNRLERLRLIEAEASDDRRLPYRMTELGIGHLRARLASLNRVVRYGAEDGDGDFLHRRWGGSRWTGPLSRRFKSCCELAGAVLGKGTNDHARTTSRGQKHACGEWTNHRVYIGDLHKWNRL